MSYTPKNIAKAQLRQTARDAKAKKTPPKGDTIKTGPRSRAGNAPNVASLTSSIGSTKRKEVLKFVGAIARSARTRKGLLEALRNVDTDEGKALREATK